MSNNFWTEEYFCSPDFEDMYNYIPDHPEHALVFYSSAEVEHGDELFYQLCVFEEYPQNKYADCEKELADVFSKLTTKNKIVAYAASRKFVRNKDFIRLSGLDKLQLKNLIEFCDTRQLLSSRADADSFLLCATRGLASTCALAVEWKILFLMQDLHGCILYNEDSNKEGLAQVIKLLQEHGFISSGVDEDRKTRGQGDGSVVSG